MSGHPHGDNKDGGHPGGHPGEHPGNQQGTDELAPPRLVAWEVTRRCNLSCLHCRAAAINEPDPDELNTEQGLKLIDQIAEMGGPTILILTGGEPLMRDDVFELAAYGTKKGLKVAMAPNGTLLTAEKAEKIKASGVDRISLSLDGANAHDHDEFRGVEGAFEGVMNATKFAVDAGLEFQINTTVTRSNMDQIEAIQDMVIDLGASAHHIFLLVPTGRGRNLAGEVISAQEYENVLSWFYDRQLELDIELKATCAPHYHRILRQRSKGTEVKVDFQTFGPSAFSRGCLGGQGFVFISHTGQVQPCGYLELDCGQVKKQDFGDIYRTSPEFLKLRDRNAYVGKCGPCEYHKVCGGCRARAFENTGDYLTEEPLCLYQPVT